MTTRRRHILPPSPIKVKSPRFCDIYICAVIYVSSNMTLITFTVLPVLAVASVILFPIVNDRWDDPVGISVMNQVVV